MKALIFMGDHPRHKYFFEKIGKYFHRSLFIEMKREELLPNIEIVNKIDKENFTKHFNIREEVEKKNFVITETKDKNIEICKINPNELGSNFIYNKVLSFKPDVCFVFGTNIISKEFISILPEKTFNIHLGLSPRYRGAATLFWPFYFLEPQYCGVTFHKLSTTVDSGDILHQTVPDLEYGDRLHDVAVKTIMKSRNDLDEIISAINNGNKLKFVKQNPKSKLWLKNDFKPYHLRVNYTLFNDDIVDYYLDGELKNPKPNLVCSFWK